MKKIPLAVACIIMLHCALFGQGYTPMPDTLALWGQSWEAGWGPMNNVYQRVNIFTSGKTTISNMPYVELRRSGYGKPTMNGGTEYYNDTLLGFYRSDTVTGKVFFRQSVSDTDQVLYDFSLKVGDTIPITTIGSYPGIVIDSVDTVWMDGHARRRLMFWDYSFIPGAMGAIIEGIGSVHGLTWDLVVPLEPAVSSLDCYRHADSTYMGFVAPPMYEHPQSWHVPCVFYNGVNELYDESVKVSVSNPVNNELRIETEFTGPGESIFKLCNTIGQEVKIESLTTETTTVPRGNLPNGVYFWRVENKGKTVQAGKLLFQ